MFIFAGGPPKFRPFVAGQAADGYQLNGPETVGLSDRCSFRGSSALHWYIIIIYIYIYKVYSLGLYVHTHTHTYMVFIHR